MPVFLLLDWFELHRGEAAKNLKRRLFTRGVKSFGCIAGERAMNSAPFSITPAFNSGVTGGTKS